MATPTIPQGVNVNFAEIYHIHSEPAAIVFAAVYVPLALFYIFQYFRRPTSVSLVLALFCTSTPSLVVVQSQPYLPTRPQSVSCLSSYAHY